MSDKIVIKLDFKDRELFPKLRRRQSVIMYEDDTGFVYSR